MVGMDFRAASRGFFDRERVMRRVTAAERRVLSKFGAFVRQRGRTSIRKRKGTSPPGKPPHSHLGILRKLLFFSWDPGPRSVVIGPTISRRGSQAPRLLEHGGDTTIPTQAGSVRATYRPRPFMGPAFAAEKPRLPDLWRNAVK